MPSDVAATKIVLAGATGALGRRIARALQEHGAETIALVRRGSASGRTAPLRQLGIGVREVDFGSRSELSSACAGAACVISALSGLYETIVEAQSALLEAAVAAGVPRFIPSDFSIDYTGLKPGSNRNFDLRRDFSARLDAAPVKPTSIFNGAFADMLTGQFPLIVKPLARVLYIENPDQPLDFTTMDDTAAFTAMAALDAETPRRLHVAGDRISARQLAAIMSTLEGRPYRLLWGGNLAMLAGIIKALRAVTPDRGQVFPPWQGMQYMHNMFSGEAGTPALDNDRYPDLRWTPVRDVLAGGAS